MLGGVEERGHTVQAVGFASGWDESLLGVLERTLGQGYRAQDTGSTSQRCRHYVPVQSVRYGWTLNIAIQQGFYFPNGGVGKGAPAPLRRRP